LTPIYDEGGIVNFDPVNVQKHLEGAYYPASGEELDSTAESNDAPATSWLRPGVREEP
jgi:hypothetical protein